MTIHGIGRMQKQLPYLPPEGMFVLLQQFVNFPGLISLFQFFRTKMYPQQMCKNIIETFCAGEARRLRHLFTHTLGKK